MEELQALYEDGHSLLIYQHTARVMRRDLIRAKLKQLYEAFEIEHFTSLLIFRVDLRWICSKMESEKYGW